MLEVFYTMIDCYSGECIIQTIQLTTAEEELLKAWGGLYSSLVVDNINELKLFAGERAMHFIHPDF